MISKESIFHYFLIYIVIALQGALLFKIYTDAFLLLAFVISILFFLKSRDVEKKAFIWFVLLAVSLLTTYMLSSESLTITAILGVLVRFMFTYVVFLYNPERFLDRITRLIVFFALISILGYLIGLVSPEILMQGSPIPLSSNIRQQFAVGYGKFFYVYLLHEPLRNAGIFTEPGLHQIALNIAIYLLLFRRHELTIKREKLVLAILVTALATTFSTTGMLCAALQVLAYVFFYKTDRGNIKGYLIVAVVGIVCILETFSEVSIIHVFTAKLYNANGVFDLTASTGNSRVLSMIADMMVFLRYPFGAGHQIYNSIWASYLTENIPDAFSCVGITKTLAILGVVSTALIVFFFIYRFAKNRYTIGDYISLGGIILTTTFSQPELYYPLFIAILLVSRQSEDTGLEVNYD